MVVVIELGPASILEDRQSVDVGLKTNSVAVKFLSHSHRCTKGVQLIRTVVLVPFLLQSSCQMSKGRSEERNAYTAIN